MSERIEQPRQAVETMDKGGPQYVAVLEIPPVDSAETAVKIALAAQGK